MTNRRRLFLVGLAVLLCSGSALGEEGLDDSAGGLLKVCKGSIEGSGDTFRNGYCVGFVRAAWASTEFWQPAVPDTGGRICIPAGVTLGQLIRVVVKHFEDHPEILHKDAYFSTILALGIAFPCEHPKPKKGGPR